MRYQSHSDDTKWYDYSHNYVPIVFKGNSDPFSEKHNQVWLEKNSWDVSKMNYFLSLTAGIPP